MKRFLSLVLIGWILLFSCPAMEPENAPETAESRLSEIFTGIAMEYFPGTAGCSLTAARLAGELLDWNASCGLTAEEQGNIISTVMEQSGVVVRTGLAGKLGSILGSMDLVCGETGPDLADCAGYQLQHYPYDLEQAAEFENLLWNIETATDQLYFFRQILHLEPDSAGGSLKAVRLAACLSDWVSMNCVSPSELQSYVSGLSSDDRERFLWNWEILAGCSRRLLSGYDSEYLIDAGYYPMTEEHHVEQIEQFFQSLQGY